MKENKRPGQQLKGLSVQDLLGVSGEESAMEIDIRLIHPFKDHPFKVLDDDKMQDLVESSILVKYSIHFVSQSHCDSVSISWRHFFFRSCHLFFPL